MHFFRASYILAICHIAIAQEGLGRGSKRLSYNLTTPYSSKTLSPEIYSLGWIGNAASSQDGWVLNGNTIKHFLTGESVELMSESSFFNSPPMGESISPNHDNSKILLAFNTTKGYRYSKYSDYFVRPAGNFSIDLIPLHSDQSRNIALAQWSPTDPDVIAFVMKNNLYIWRNGTNIQITKDGSDSVFHGIPDWVYEEEVLESRKAFWFSPDGTHVAFLTFDDSQVPEYTISHFIDNHKFAQPYPREERIRYPKPGFPNPKVTARISKVSDPQRFIDIPLDIAFPNDDLIVGEVHWVTGTHKNILVRCFNRVQNEEKLVLFEMLNQKASLVRNRKATDGWIDINKSTRYLGKIETPKYSGDYYVDISDQDGWNHIYLHDLLGGASQQLTRGTWEVRSIDKVIRERGQIFFTSAEKHPTESHPYSISLWNNQTTLLVNDNQPGFWTTSYSARGEYVLLNYNGPNIPFQGLYFSNDTRPSRQIASIGRNRSKLATTLEQFNLPIIRYVDLQHPEGYNLSALIRYPPSFPFDAASTKKHPLLLTPYGGPGSQEVDKQFLTPEWKSYIVSDEDLEFITLTVDNRGTGYRGRAFRQAYYRNQGVADVRDQIWAAREFIKQNPWVDTQHVGIWGWSNGGYLAAKVIEANSGVFTFGMATAPTSDPALYDSIYTERYLGLQPSNTNTNTTSSSSPSSSSISYSAYDQAALRNATGFRALAGRFLIQTGTADDNVHAAHTLGLAATLMAQGVPPHKLVVQPFVDSEHNMLFRNDHGWLYQQLTQWLYEEKKRVPERGSRQWQWGGAGAAGGASGAGGSGGKDACDGVGRARQLPLQKRWGQMDYALDDSWMGNGMMPPKLGSTARWRVMGDGDGDGDDGNCE